MNKKLTIKELILIALFVALTAIFSQIMIPINQIPINLATLSIFIVSGLFGAKVGGLSQFIYVLLGAIGVPVFAGFTGGYAIILGPTGGYIIGYIVGAIVIGLLKELLHRTVLGYAISMLLGLLSCYILGTVWFIFITKTNLISAIILCVLPYIPGDLMKIVLAIFLIKRLERVVNI